MNVEQLREICLKLPHTTEDMKWGENLCFLIGEKIYCLASLDAEFSVSFKVTQEDFQELIQKEGINQAPHFARLQWINVKEQDALTEKEWHELLSKAYGLIKSKLPKKMQQTLK